MAKPSIRTILATFQACEYRMKKFDRFGYDYAAAVRAATSEDINWFVYQVEWERPSIKAASVLRFPKACPSFIIRAYRNRLAGKS